MPFSKNIVLIGASGHSKVIIDIVEREAKYNIIGLIDSFKSSGDDILGYKILGNEESIPDLIKKYKVEAGIIAIGDNWIRKVMHEKIKKIFPTFNYVNAIHPQAIIGKKVTIGHGTVIMPGAIINSDSSIGNFCIVNTNASLGHDGKIKDYSSLAPGVVAGGNVSIGTCTAISLGVKIIQNINIGKHTIIGAGSLVIRDIEDYKMAYGVPATVVRSIDKGEKYLYKHEGNKSAKENKSPIIFEAITRKDEWDSLIKEIGHYDFYHTYDYHHTSKSEHESPVLLKYQEKDIIIALPLLIRNVFNTPYKDATCVYGYAGPISKGVNNTFNNKNFIKSLKIYFKENNIISVFNRLNPYIDFQDVVLADYGKIKMQGKVVNIDLTLDVEEQRQNYQSRLKTHVNKSRRNCTVKRVLNDNDLSKFIEIYHENMDRINARESYYFSDEYYKRMTKSKDFETETLLAVHNETGEVIAGSMFIKTNNIVQYHLSGSINNYLYLTPTKLLIDEMRLKAKKEGYTYFNLGGGLGGYDDDSLFRFKSSFAKDFKKFNLWNLIVDEEAYQKLVSEKNIVAKTNFFPLYRYSEENK